MHCVKTMQYSLAESQAFLPFFLIKNILYSDMSYIIFYPEISQKTFQAKYYNFMLNILNFKKEKWIQSPNKRAVSWLETVYWMNHCTDWEQHKQTHHTSFSSLTLTSEEKQQQDPQTSRHMASLNLKDGTGALNEIWLLIARH